MIEAINGEAKIPQLQTIFVPNDVAVIAMVGIGQKTIIGRVRCHQHHLGAMTVRKVILWKFGHDFAKTQRKNWDKNEDEDNDDEATGFFFKFEN